MVLDSALTDAEIRGDVLAGMAGEDQFQDLALSPREARDASRRILSPGKWLAQYLMLMEQVVDLAKQGRFSGERLA
jgi:hypothetical protein